MTENQTSEFLPRNDSELYFAKKQPNLSLSASAKLLILSMPTFRMDGCHRSLCLPATN